MKTQTKVMISLELSENMKQMLQAEAAEKEMSTSALIRYIIKQYYNKNEANN